jgi:hypothetical protein
MKYALNNFVPKDNVINYVFDHVRNIIISATITSSGLYATKIIMQEDPSIEFSLCLATTLIGGGLFLLNYLQLWRKAIDAHVSIAYPILAAPIYISFAILIYQLIWLENALN